MLKNTWCFSCFGKVCVVLYLGDVISECDTKINSSFYTSTLGCMWQPSGTSRVWGLILYSRACISVLSLTFGLKKAAGCLYFTEM